MYMYIKEVYVYVFEEKKYDREMQRTSIDAGNIMYDLSCASTM